MKRTKFYVAAGLGLAQFVLLYSNASAQDRNPETLGEVVVTASRSPKKISEIGKVARVITAETLSKSQGRTLPEVLNNIAGITIGGNGNNPGDVKSVYLRGASAANTLILIDGIPVNDASEITGEYNISAIPVDQVERVEILKGGNSTLYGSDAVAGVINIITKKGAGKLAASLLATGGSYDTYKQVLGLNGEIGTTSVAFNASNLDSKSFSTAAPGKGETNFDKDGFHQKSVSLNLGQQLSNKFRLSGNFQGNNNQADLDNGAFADAKNYTYDKTALLAGLGGKYTIDKGAIGFNVSQNNVRNRYNNNGSITNNSGKISHLEANFNYAFNSNIDIASGASYRFSKTHQHNTFSPPLFADNNIKSLFTSLFVRSNSGFQAELGGRMNDHSQYGSNFTYTINPSYLFAERYKVFVNVSSAYRVPSLYQLFSQYGNLNLEPETSVTYEAGLDFNFTSNLNFAFSYFKRDIDKVIDFGQVTPGVFGYINQNNQKDQGFEVELGYRPITSLNLTAFYAHVDGEVTTPASQTFNLFRRPKDSFGLNTGFDASEALSFNLIYKFTGDRQDRYFDNSTFKTIDAEMKAYNMVDLYAQFKATQRITIFTDVKNLLDENYVDFSGYNTKGLNFNAGFRLDFR
ncbi:TonB-dependent receptor plug domain-containing protein [Daejeonella lutea]|uniref:Vitamin B12 transporter n=1 Tax=Daejeonella lutea TaxID=572036 RepID=A0A1T5AFY5_9SPHI|nr:TonB-dependent receptor [Daejeonella lutea]SKB33825.1 vitamin B12 transporter [Daejeonella lutea]